MRRLAFAVFLCLLAAACTWDDHEPCSVIDGKGSGPSSPVPGELPAPGPGPGDGLENDATYRVSNGVVCRCGAGELGCSATPEEAERAATCRPSPYGPEYPDNCQSVMGGELPPADEAEPSAVFDCRYTKVHRKTRKGETLSRTQDGKDIGQATRRHVDWCDSKSNSDSEYYYQAGTCS